MIKARCSKCGRTHGSRWLTILGNRTKATIWDRQTQIKIVLRKFGDNYIYYVARSGEGK
jgi:hypothetical protein